MSGREGAAVLGGVLAGCAVLMAALGAGLLLYQRLLTGSIAALVLVLIVATALGGYAGWLLGLVVFSNLRAAPAGPVESE